MPDIKKAKTILITGGAGFIGSHLCDYYIEAGHKVICVDSFFSGRKENISHLLSNKNFILIKHNIIFPLKNKFTEIDEIYNLACPASPVQYQFDPILTLKTSVLGTLNMLDIARKYGAKMIQASTSEVYGDPEKHPQTEEYFGNVDPIGKRSCYDEGKRAAESLCKDYYEQYEVDVRVVRLFNVYGPRMMFNDGRVISNFILQSIIGDDITVYGRGEQSRSFMYIGDLIKAFVKLIELEKNIKKFEPVNIGNPDERSIKSLAEDIKNISKSHSPIVYIDYEKIPERLGDPQRRCPDISRIKSLTGWSPTIDFTEGLAKTIEDFNNRLSNKTKILVFIPTFLPLEGPAEKAVKEISDRLIGYDFDIITSRFDKKYLKSEKIGRVNVYRVGLGNKFDKYWLPVLAVLMALKLNKKNNYQVAWGVMASYGSLGALFFSMISRVSFLLSLYEGKVENKSKMRKSILSPLQKIIFQKAHHIQLIAELSEQRLAWLEGDKKLRPMNWDNGWDYAAKKTKEEFQEMEILTSRL